MTQKKQQSEHVDIWQSVGENDLIYRSSDGYHAHVWKHGSTWKGQVTVIATKKYRRSKLTYPSNSAAQSACQVVMDAMRERRKRSADPQSSLL